MPSLTPAEIQFASDSSVLVTFAGEPSLEMTARVLNLTAKLQAKKQDWAISELHPAYCGVLIEFDPLLCLPENLAAHLVKIAEQIRAEPGVDHSSDGFVTIAVEYGGESGPDLESLALELKMTPDEVIRLHSSVEYRVAFLGFAPGFPYLLGLPERLRCPRKATPRLRVPAGSVALADLQTGIYPFETPGGWQVIGRTRARLFSPDMEQITLLRPGDRVRFEPHEDLEPVKIELPGPTSTKPRGVPVLNVLEVGVGASLQDLGRSGQAHLGISPGGAADPVALRLGNSLVGNDARAAALEVTGSKSVFRFAKDSWIVLTGADCSPRLDQQKVAMWTSLPVCEGQRLEMKDVKGGLRSYLCVHGGFDGPVILESRSTSISGRWGGIEGRELRAGDTLCESREKARDPRFRHAKAMNALYTWTDTDIVIRVTRGPQWSWFEPESRARMFAAEFQVTDEVNRMGSRFAGPTLVLEESYRGRELVTEGVANGTLQVAPNGQIMLLFCEQRTTGGYPKIANVVRADWHVMGQLAPGARFRFLEVALEEAWRIDHEFEKVLQDSVCDF